MPRAASGAENCPAARIAAGGPPPITSLLRAWNRNRPLRQWSPAPRGPRGWRQLQACARQARLREQAFRPVVVELGAGTAIGTVRHFAAGMCRDFRDQGARLIRINPREPDVADALDVGLPMGALATLRALEAAW